MFNDVVVIHDISVSNDVRSAAVNKLVGVEFSVIKVGCILFFRTTGISGGTAAAAPPPFRPSDPALCGSRPLVANITVD